MRPRTPIHLLTLVVSCVVAYLASPPTKAAAPAPQATAAMLIAEAEPRLPPVLTDRRFDVFFDERRVGSHTFTFEGQPEDFSVVSEAAFEFKLAFVTAFSYDHEAREVWRAGCMQTMASTTHQGGSFVRDEDWDVTAEEADTGFSVKSLEGGQTYDLDCPWGFAYWNPGMRDRAMLINPQDGRVFEVEFREMDPRPISMGERRIRARAFSLKAEDLEMTLYYDDQDRWIGLDTRVGEDRTMRYRPSMDDPFFPG